MTVPAQVLTLTSTNGFVFALRDDGAVFVLGPKDHEWRECPRLPGTLRAEQTDGQATRARQLLLRGNGP